MSLNGRYREKDPPFGRRFSCETHTGYWVIEGAAKKNLEPRITQPVTMFSCSAKVRKYFANSRARHVADLRSEILVGRLSRKSPLLTLEEWP